MDKSEIVVGEDYAYLSPGVKGPHEPLKAVVNKDPESGYVEVTLYHPDSGQSVERVRTRELAGRWEDEPDAIQQHKAALDAAHERGEKLTWRMVAEKRYAGVQRQRALADRLTALGIQRAKRNYATKGGSSTRPHDTDLQLNYDEIEWILDRIERGTTATSVPLVTTDAADNGEVSS